MSKRRKIPVYRDCKLHVLAEQCATCIFRPGNLMMLEHGRAAGMLRQCQSEDTVIPCHEYMDTKTPAVCRGLFELREVFPGVRCLQLADRLGFVEYDKH